ncbi:MAG TPA: hypothetical protein VGB82_05280 [Alphaproteobacteria bacterium]
MNTKTILTATSAALVATAISIPTLFAQTQMPNAPQGSMGPGTMQGGGMMQRTNPSTGNGDMNKMMADCDKMMKDKGMKMPGDMNQMMDQCAKMMNSQGAPPAPNPNKR